MQRLLNTGKEAIITGSSTAHLVPPPLQTTGLSEVVSLLTVKVSVLKLPHPVLYEVCHKQTPVWSVQDSVYMCLH